ncbi:MAG: hypothetical protein F4210_04460 [Holophagales bacterium]|nr:hypothetical protein [Holophagales bacterium]MYF94757.1 hypothetical protein [Holophagales bacterium]
MNKTYGSEWIRSMVSIVISPPTSLAIIRTRRPWVGVFLVVAGASILLALPSRDSVLAATSTALEGVDEQAAAAAPIFYYATLALSPVFLVAEWLVAAVVIWLLVLAFGGTGRFAQAFSLAAHLGVINVLAQVTGVLVLATTGGPQSPCAPSCTALGPNLLLSTESAALNAMYENITPFTVWQMALLCLGAVAVFGLSRTQAAWLASIFWTAGTAFMVATASLGAVATPLE